MNRAKLEHEIMKRTYGCPSELDGVGPTWTGGQQGGPQAVQEVFKLVIKFLQGLVMVMEDKQE